MYLTASKRRKRFFRRKKLLVIALAVKFYHGILERHVERHYARFDLDLSELPQQQLRACFRVRTYVDLLRLRDALNMQEPLECDNGTRVSGLFALAVVLRRLAYPCRWGDCVNLLGRETSQLSRIFNRAVNHIYDEKGYLLETFDLRWLDADRARKYADAVNRVSEGRYDNILGFVDGTARPICRPDIFQRWFYSGHCRNHVIKFQVIVTPDGLILHVFGPVEGSRNDNYMVATSDLVRRLERKSQEWGNYYALYGDKGYALSEQIQVPFRGPLNDEETEFNVVMSRCRIAVEHGFGKIATQFAFGSYQQNNKLYWQQSAKAYLVSALLTNCLTCLYGFDLVSKRFGVEAPDLEDYLRGIP